MVSMPPLPSRRLFYVIGPSGAGKDSLIDYARGRLDGRPVAFAHRYVTRPATAGGENHVALTEGEFAAREATGCFAMTWGSHGLHYGLGTEIRFWMDRGLTVVVNGSRGYLPTAAKDFPDLVPVLIRVAPDVLEGRLRARGRETEDDIAERLRRAAAFDVRHPALVVIDNNGPLEEAGDRLVALLSGATTAPCS